MTALSRRPAVGELALPGVCIAARPRLLPRSDRARLYASRSLTTCRCGPARVRRLS